MTVVLSILVALLVIVVGIIAALVTVSLRPPRVHQFLSPGMLGLPQESVQFETSDGVNLSGWWCEAPGDLVVVACHGYIVNRCEWVPTTTFLADGQTSFLFFDHRAHGRSGGRKVTFGYNERRDVLAAMEFVRERKPAARIVLLGSSMGAVAAALAMAETEPKPVAAVLDSPFRSLNEALDGWFVFLFGPKANPFFWPVVKMARLALGFDPATVRPVDAVVMSGVPTLFFFGLADPLIPRASSESVVATIGESGEVVFFPDQTHGAGRLNMPDLFRQRTLAFLEKHGVRPASSDPSGQSDPSKE